MIFTSFFENQTGLPSITDRATAFACSRRLDLRPACRALPAIGMALAQTTFNPTGVAS